jgi:phosphoglucosamine mutase
VISASHNPFADNGIKVFARDGYKLPDAIETEIEQLMRSPDLDAQRAAPADVGYNRKLEDSRGRYVVYCKATFPAEATLDGLRIVVDGAHGAAYRVAPAVFEELGATVIAIHTNPNGKNINARAGALYPEAMCEAVRLHDAHLGVALDGDGDRCVLCDEHGNVIDGDALMALCATRMLAAGTLAKNTLVTTVMSNIGLERAMKDRGGILVRTQVGDRYVVEEMRRAGYNFGGEQSGHLVFLDHATTGDGIVAALRVLAIMRAEGKPLSELATVMTRMPQVLVNLQVERKVPLDQLPEVMKAITDVEQKLGGDGRVLVRYSGTESKARVMIEGSDEMLIKSWADEIAAVLAKSTQA